MSKKSTYDATEQEVIDDLLEQEEFLK